VGRSTWSNRFGGDSTCISRTEGGGRWRIPAQAQKLGRRFRCREKRVRGKGVFHGKVRRFAQGQNHGSWRSTPSKSQFFDAEHRAPISRCATRVQQRSVARKNAPAGDFGRKKGRPLHRRRLVGKPTSPATGGLRRAVATSWRQNHPRHRGGPAHGVDRQSWPQGRRKAARATSHGQGSPRETRQGRRDVPGALNGIDVLRFGPDGKTGGQSLCVGWLFFLVFFFVRAPSDIFRPERRW